MACGGLKPFSVSQPEQFLRLHREATLWYQRQGWAYEAIPHALATHDYVFVAELLKDCVERLSLQGELKTLLTMNAMPNWLLESPTNATMKSEDKKAKPEDITTRKLAPTLHYDGLLLAETSGKLESFRAVSAEVLPLGGSKGLPFLKPSLDALEKILPHVAKRVEFPGLEHGGSNNPTQTNRGSKPELVAQELRQFFA